jgi:PQ loop repeat.
MGFLELLSGFFGLAYFTAWSISFYPQGILNYRRKSTSGTVVDFHLINILGESLLQALFALICLPAPY